MPLPDSTPLGIARDWTRKRADEGVDCPCCTQRVQVYKRKLNSGMARSLIAMYALAHTDWIHVPTAIGARSREEGKLAYWALVEGPLTPRDDGGRAGWWRVTSKGELFVRQQLRIPSHARVYDGKVLGLMGNPISIVDALGTKFNYSELMAGI